MARRKYRRNYRFRYWRRKKTVLDESSIIMLVGLVGLGWLGTSLDVDGVRVDQLMIELAFLVIFCGLGLLGFVVWKNRQKWQQVRALRLANVDRMSGVEFEKYVGNLFKDRGYRVLLTPNNDYGADLVAKKGKNKYVVQMKRYKGKVGIGAVQQVVGAAPFYGANKSAVVTNSYFTYQAKNLAKSNECVLVDREMLAKWIWEFSKGKRIG